MPYYFYKIKYTNQQRKKKVMEKWNNKKQQTVVEQSNQPILLKSYIELMILHCILQFKAYTLKEVCSILKSYSSVMKGNTFMQ